MPCWMRRKLEWGFRGLLIGLVLVVVGVFYARAQHDGTNAPAATTLPRVLTTLPALLESVPKHYITFGLDRVTPLRENSFLGEPLWKYAASLIYVALAFLIARAIDFLFGFWLKRWTERTKNQIDDVLVELLRGPIKVVAFVLFLHIGLNLFDWPPSLAVLLSKAFVVVVALSITYLLLKIADVLMNLWRDRSGAMHDRLFSEHLFPLVQKTVRIGVVVGAAILTMDNLGIRITSLLAGLSVGGLALGLAAQDTVANFFGAVAILLDKPFQVGDRIKVDALEGNVETIGLRSTRVRSTEGHHITIPNKTVANAAITNITRRPSIRTEMNFGLTYDTTPEKVRRAVKIIEEVFRASPETTDLLAGFNKFTDSTLNIFVVHVWNGTEIKPWLAAMQEMNLKLKERFDAEGIDFAFPTQTIHLKAEGEPGAKPGANN